MTTTENTVEDKVLSILVDITDTDEVRRNLDLALFDQGVLDSFSMVELIIWLSDDFGIKISPAEINRDDWSSPRKIIAYVQQRCSND